ncbi:MAG: hypothetical protein R2695_11765 [Acidimicrobiales bacterium]
MLADPRLLLAAHPTRGLTSAPRPRSGTRSGPPAAGLATLLISADLDELIGLSDKPIVVMSAASSSPDSTSATTTCETSSPHDRSHTGGCVVTRASTRDPASSRPAHRSAPWCSP